MRKMCQPSAHCDKMRKFPQGLKHLWPKQQQRQQTGYCPNHSPFFPFSFSIHRFSLCLSFSVLSSFSLHLSEPLCRPLFLSLLSLFPFISFFNIPLFLYSSLTLHSCLNPTPYKAPLPCNRFHQRFLLAKEEYMVIKGSAAKRDGERLHPAADVEQEGKKEKRGGEGGERRGEGAWGQGRG